MSVEQPNPLDTFINGPTQRLKLALNAAIASRDFSSTRLLIGQIPQAQKETAFRANLAGTILFLRETSTEPEREEQVAVVMDALTERNKDNEFALHYLKEQTEPELRRALGLSDAKRTDQI